MFPRTLRLRVAVDILLIVLGMAALILPLFRMRYMDNWASIESTFISDARFLSENWPSPKWQPLWYAGTRFDYIYPPALRYGTAGLAHYYPNMTTAKAYHIYTAFFYCVGIAGVYFLVHAASGSRRAGWLAALLTAFCSPSFLFPNSTLAEMLTDMPRLSTQRFNALIRYGEGPHITALGLMPIALASAWFALRRFSPVAVACAALFSCLLVSNNFYGASAFALAFPLLVWSLWITHLDNRIFWRALAIGALAYSLTAFWLTPSYLAVTLENMRYVSNPGNKFSLWIFVGQIVLFLILTDRYARGRRERAWPVFVMGFAFVFALQVLGNVTFDFRVIGEPQRWVPELDLALILLFVLVLEWAFSHRWRFARWVAYAALLIALVPCAVALRYTRQFIPKQSQHQDRFEYKITNWIHENLPGQRLYVTGTLRFWFNGWHNIPHVGGGSEQGLANGTVIPAQWELNLGPELEPSQTWLEATGADAVIVHGPKSKEFYRDIVTPAKFKDWQVLYDDGEDNLIYRVPRRFPGIARAVDTTAARAIPTPTGTARLADARPYAKMLNEGPAIPATVRFTSSDSFVVSSAGPLPPNTSLTILESFDSSWRATANGRELPVIRDALGFMRIDAPPPGAREIHFQFSTPMQNQAGRLITTAGAFSLIAYCFLYRRREPIL
jgi:hypothetical protein